MKTLILSCLLTVSTLSYAGIISIVTPTVMCHGETETFTTRYTFEYSPFGLPRETVNQVKWEFLRNNSVFKTLYSSGFTQQTPHTQPVGTATITTGGLPSGPITIRVTIRTFYMSTGFSQIKTYTLSKNVRVGILPPTSVSGPAFLCNGATSMFSATAVTGAASYTWIVPEGWTVEGQPGPVVTGLSNNVYITVDGAPMSTDTIKVMAVSATCGATEPVATTLTIDYEPLSFSSQYLGNLVTRISVAPYGYTNYTWTIPDSWTMIQSSEQYIEVYTNGQSDSLYVSAISPCGTPVTAAYYHQSDEQRYECIKMYPTLVESSFTIDPCNVYIYSVIVDGSLVLTPEEIVQEGEVYRINATRIPPGIHILQVYEEYGYVRTLRFVKQ